MADIIVSELPEHVKRIVAEFEKLEPEEAARCVLFLLDAINQACPEAMEPHAPQLLMIAGSIANRKKRLDRMMGAIRGKLPGES